MVFVCFVFGCFFWVVFAAICSWSLLWVPDRAHLLLVAPMSSRSLPVAPKTLLVEHEKRVSSAYVTAQGNMSKSTGSTFVSKFKENIDARKPA